MPPNIFCFPLVASVGENSITSKTISTECGQWRECFVARKKMRNAYVCDVACNLPHLNNAKASGTITFKLITCHSWGGIRAPILSHLRLLLVLPFRLFRSLSQSLARTRRATACSDAHVRLGTKHSRFYFMVCLTRKNMPSSFSFVSLIHEHVPGLHWVIRGARVRFTYGKPDQTKKRIRFYILSVCACCQWNNNEIIVFMPNMCDSAASEHPEVRT